MHAMGWSSKYMMVDAKTIDDMIVIFKSAAEELEAMRDDGVELRFDVGVSRGNALLVTDDDDVARRYRFRISDHQGWAGPGIMLPGHPLWNEFCDAVEEEWPLEERLGFPCDAERFPCGLDVHLVVLGARPRTCQRPRKPLLQSVR